MTFTSSFTHEELYDFIVEIFLPIYENDIREVEWEGVSHEDKCHHALNWAITEWKEITRQIKEDQEAKRKPRKEK